jgi:hypothetical protein
LPKALFMAISESFLSIRIKERPKTVLRPACR